MCCRHAMSGTPWGVLGFVANQLAAPLRSPLIAIGMTSRLTSCSTRPLACRSPAHHTALDTSQMHLGTRHSNESGACLTTSCVATCYIQCNTQSPPTASPEGTTPHQAAAATPPPVTAMLNNSGRDCCSSSKPPLNPGVATAAECIAAPSNPEQALGKE